MTPFELVKIRLQDQKSAYTGPAHVVRAVLARDGPLGLYAGMEATLWRHVFWNAGYFASIHAIRQRLPVPRTKAQKMGTDFVAGAIGGTLGTVLNTPFDVVKSRSSPGLFDSLSHFK